MPNGSPKQINALIVGGPAAGEVYVGEPMQHIFRAEKLLAPTGTYTHIEDPAVGDAVRAQAYALQTFYVGNPHVVQYFYVPVQWEKDGGWWLMDELKRGYRKAATYLDKHVTAN